jgi:hypothetical protein
MPMPELQVDPTASLETLSAAAQAQQQADSPGSEPQAAPEALFADFDDEDDSSDLPPDRSYLKAIATELARATLGSLGDKELRHAKKVDFSHVAGAAMESMKDSCQCVERNGRGQESGGASVSGTAVRRARAAVYGRRNASCSRTAA